MPKRRSPALKKPRNFWPIDPRPRIVSGKKGRGTYKRKPKYPGHYI